MVIEIVPEDGSTLDYVNIKIYSQADTTVVYHSENIPVGQATLVIVNNMGAGYNYIEYTGGRYNMRYTVNIILYITIFYC